MPGSLEVVPALCRFVELADFTDCVEDLGKGSCTDLSQVCFQLGEGLCCLFVPVGRQVIESGDSAGRDLGDQHFADVGGEGGAIHCALDDPWRDQCVLCQASNQRLRTPTAKGRVHRQAFTPFCPAA